MSINVIKKYFSIIGRRGGLKVSAKKSISSKANGRLGGRPKNVNKNKTGIQGL